MSLIDALFKNQILFDIFRQIVHKNFELEKKTIKKELDLSKISTVLDFGCGIGQHSDIFIDKNYYGLDSDERCIAYAKEHFKGNFILSNDKKLPFESGFFDAVLVNNTFHHIPDGQMDDILKELHRVVKKSGAMFVLDIVSSKNQTNPVSRLMVGLDRGKFARDFEQIRPYFENYFKIQKCYYIKTALYRYKEYIIILSSNAGK